MNPIDEALANKEKLAAERRGADLELWHAWKQNPSTETMQPLMHRFEPVFQSKIQQFKAPQVNEVAFKTHLKNLAINAFKSYKPEKAGLRTHVENHLRKAMRYNAELQNFARIPEEKAGLIGHINRAHDILSEDLSRPPTENEIADFLNPQLSTRKQLTALKVQQIRSAQWRDVPESSFESDPTPRELRRDDEIVSLLRPDLSTDEQSVFDHIYGHNGKKKLDTTKSIAIALGKTEPQISRLRTGIFNKIEKYR